MIEDEELKKDKKKEQDDLAKKEEVLNLKKEGDELHVSY